METGEDPYSILGISTTATPSEIRSAYRRLAIQHHPDKQRTPDEKERVTPLFVKISNAYELLSDPEQRAQYDQQQPSSSFASSADHFAFHDPFQVFEELFRSQMMQGSMFPSMLGGNLFGMDNTTMNMGMNMGDPFLNGLGLFPTPAFRNFMTPLGSHPPRSASAVAFSSSRTNNSNNNAAGQSVQILTTTRIVNGRTETRTERIVKHADGTTERIIETPVPNNLAPLETRISATPEVSSDGAESSSSTTEEGSSPKRKASSSSCEEKKSKKRKPNPPREGDRDHPIELE